MTSVLLVKAPRQIVAVADGRLSVDTKTVSFETAEKIRLFTPKYSIPHVSMGWFSHFSPYLGEGWCLAYSGTYALADQISQLFFKNVTNLYLIRGEDGIPKLQHEFDQSGSFHDSYNFSPDEKPKLTPPEILGEFKKAFQSKGDEWARNRGCPDCQFLLFGMNEETSRYAAYKIKAEWHPGVSMGILTEEVTNGELAAIGSPVVAAAAYDDACLQDGLRGWKVDQVDAAMAQAFDPSPPAALPPAANWSLRQVRQRLCEIMRTEMDPSVGGILTTASGSGMSITVETEAAELF